MNQTQLEKEIAKTHQKLAQLEKERFAARNQPVIDYCEANEFEFDNNVYSKEVCKLPGLWMNVYLSTHNLSDYGVEVIYQETDECYIDESFDSAQKCADFLVNFNPQNQKKVEVSFFLSIVGLDEEKAIQQLVDQIYEIYHVGTVRDFISVKQLN